MTENKQATQTNPAPKKPNETGAIRVDGFVKIHDPKTKQVFVEKRA